MNWMVTNKTRARVESLLERMWFIHCTSILVDLGCVIGPIVTSVALILWRKWNRSSKFSCFLLDFCSPQEKCWATMMCWSNWEQILLEIIKCISKRHSFVNTHEVFTKQRSKDQLYLPGCVSDNFVGKQQPSCRLALERDGRLKI